MCEAFQLSALAFTWGIIAFNIAMVVINVRTLRKAHQMRAEYAQLLLTMGHELTKLRLHNAHMEALN